MLARAPGQWRAISTRPAVAATFLAAVVFGACSPLATTIAEESGADGSADSRGARGRVQVSVEGSGRELVTDRGSRLRGITVGSDVGLDFSIESEPELARPLIRHFFERMALEAGLNAVHVYLENEQKTLGSGRGFGDSWQTKRSARAFIWCSASGAGSTLGSFDEPLTRAFWDLYAPLYANRHTCSTSFTTAPKEAATYRSTTRPLASSSGPTT